MLLPTMLVGCTADEPGGSVRPVPDLVLDEAASYRVDTTVALASVEVATGSDACVDWSAVSERPSQVLMTALGVPIPEAGRLLLERQFGATVVEPWFATAPPDVTCVDAFSIIGNRLSLVEDRDRTWVFTVPVATCGFVGPSVALVPRDASTNLEVVLTDTTSPLVSVVELGEPLGARAGTSPVLDWSHLAQDAAGDPFDPLADHRIQVARLDLTDPAALAEAVVDLDATASELYTVPVDGLTSESLAHARDALGGPFEGFTTDGTWVVAIRPSCAALPPLALAVVEATP